jgi:DNA-binding response OmpR family regulator
MPENNKTVVIFEDSLAVRELLQFFFKKQGFETHAYEDGTDAVARVRAHSPQLIMMDLVMPGLYGLESCAAIRSKGIKTPIVVLSVKADAQNRARAMAAGADAYLVKPFKPADIAAAIEPLLRP